MTNVSISNSILRLSEYYRRHGFENTIRRFILAMKRKIFSDRMVVFYCDLDKRRPAPINIPNGLQVKRVQTLTALKREYLQTIIQIWNPKIAERNIMDRFDRGASLWLVECDEQLAGYGWTLQGKSIGQYYFPLGQNDVQFFDFYIFTRFRGRALHWLLSSHILYTLTSEGRSRVFADTGVWNQAQLASFTMTQFSILGVVKMYNIFGHGFTYWVAGDPTNIRA